jgi:hypothetical protein
MAVQTMRWVVFYILEADVFFASRPVQVSHGDLASYKVYI